MSEIHDPSNLFRLSDTLDSVLNCIDRMEDLDAGERRTLRARNDPMIVVPRVNRRDECIGIYDVFSASGSHYVVVAGERVCSCPDSQYNDALCKHVRRVEIAVRETPLSARYDVVDDYLDWLLDQIHTVRSEYPQIAERDPFAEMLPAAIEACRTVDRSEAPPTA